MIFDKPFSFSEMLRRTIFKGRPNFFNAKDLNKEFLVVHEFMEKFNERFSVVSNLAFTVTNFAETYDNNTNRFTRNISLTWTEGKVLYKGVEYQVPAGGTPTAFVHTYAAPNVTISPKEVKPATYVCLVGELVTVDYGDNPVLCGIQSDEVPQSVPTVDVEQYQNIGIVLTTDPDSLENNLAILAVIHPRYTESGAENGYGFLYYTMKNPDFRMKNGSGNAEGVFKNNQTLFEYVLERISGRLDYLLNERQLVRRFNLADLENTAKARHNIGLSKVVNHKQLVQAENLRDIEDKPLARFNLGLGNAATRNIGTGENDAAPGNVLPVGGIMMWSGAVSNIPAGWKLCDGTQGTPDLRGKFVVGHNAGVSEFNLVGKTGGSITNTIAKANLPNYDLQVTDNHTHHVPNIAEMGGTNSGTGGIEKTMLPGYGSRNTSTANSGQIKVALGGSSEPLNNLPPYYTLCYIMYVGVTITPPTPPAQPPALTYPNYSVPETTTDNGYGSYTPVGVGSSGGQTVGSGVVLTNPE